MKRVVCCLDGTWNHRRPGAILTNVAKLADLVAPVDGAGVRQVCHYVEGIVSEDNVSLQFIKGGIGLGVEDRIRKGYEALAESYEPGDEIYIFGFSRGAFQARSLASLLDLVGLGRQQNGFDFEKAWALYRQPPILRTERALADLRAAAHHPVRVRCLGVWDTVGNIGNPIVAGGPVGRMFEFHDLKPSAVFDVGLHALAIDEVRGPFSPTFWTMPTGAAPAKGQHIEQVWLPGSHADVGGGYAETGLSDVALAWMIERVTATTGLTFDGAAMAERLRPDPLGPQHSPTVGHVFWWSGRLPFIRLIRQDKRAVPPWRRSLIGTWRTSRIPPETQVVNESIHPSAVERFGREVVEMGEGPPTRLVYRPRNLAAALGRLE